ncbi:hypothetical protein IMZ31_12330 [Pontibacillus sp. ALD_SL1]|uniref:hypothetical protein n=1 Tax=Pontibacillus sp. ALD_SL1 TaxID=2777185 RepID=UPI001A9644BA|nr:hypothetical protein [Pontibacillus sp. ALD_SL1]QSS98883.1 hypothetical protein IMZ31_12330 [Pontibacillus sp. ALD_SL1]
MNVMKLSFLYSAKGLVMLTALIILIGCILGHNMIQTIPVHMALVSLLYFVIPPMILYSMSSFVPRNIAYTSPISLALFAIILTLQHASPFIQLDFLSTSWITWMLFALSVDAWRPFFIQTSTTFLYAKWSFLAVTPACLFLLMGAGVGPSLTTAYCLPEGTSLNSLESVLIHPRVDLIGSSLFMMGTHKGALYVTNRLGN